MSEYNYSNFKAEYYNFTKDSGPKDGEVAPDFVAYTLDGWEVKLSDYFGKPIVLETGSVTCPIYAGEVPPMLEMATKFPEVQFFVLYVREAHPGEKIGPHASLEEKLYCANELKVKYKEIRTILIDGVEGAAHKFYGLFPNSVYVIDASGRIAWHSQWNRTRELEENIQRTLKGEPTVPVKKKRIDKPERLKMSALFAGGRIAIRDFITQLPFLIWHRVFKK